MIPLTKIELETKLTNIIGFNVTGGIAHLARVITDEIYPLFNTEQPYCGYKKGNTRMGVAGSDKFIELDDAEDKTIPLTNIDDIRMAHHECDKIRHKITQLVCKSKSVIILKETSSELEINYDTLIDYLEQYRKANNALKILMGNIEITPPDSAA